MRILTERQLEAYVERKIREVREIDRRCENEIHNEKEHDRIETRINNLQNELENLRSQFNAHVCDTKEDHEVCAEIKRVGGIAVCQK